MPRALAIVHQPDAGPGVFADAAATAGWILDEWPIASGGPPPEDPQSYDAVLTFGGAAHPDQDQQHRWMAAEIDLLRGLLAAGRPLLGVCLGAQLLARAAGATVARAARPEIGWHPVEVLAAARSDPVLGPLHPRLTAFSWHSYAFSLPPGALELARSPACSQAFCLEGRAWGIQFHAEVTVSDVLTWIDDLGSDPDAVALNLDWGALRHETEQRAAEWSAVGQGLCRRFLQQAAAIP